MSFTNNQNFEVQPSGQADWDSGLNANFQIMDRGWHIKLTTAQAINTGDIIWASSGGLANVYNPNSLDLRNPIAISYKAVNSGQEDLFLARGIINSVDIWSGNIIPGEPIYADVVTPGFPVSSFSAAWPPVGLALADTGLYFSPGHFSPFPELISDINSFAAVVGQANNFTLDVGHRGLIQKLIIATDSMDAFKVRIWSGSARVSSELLYETITTSVDGGAADFDINTIYYLDQGMFPYFNTDVSSPGLLFLRIDPQSSATVGSSDMYCKLVAERFR